MIRPIQKKKDVYGIQGKVAFDPAKPDVDIPFYNEIVKFMQGAMGLGGSGGTLANKLKTAKSYQASHVFGSRGEREIVTERLDQQLTYFLNTQLGDAAKAAKMTIPGYLQSKGIHGISQIGTGDDAKYSAYRRDDFLQVSQNPVTGSTEKLVKAYMKGIGAAFNTSGGTNENRRLEAYLRKDDAAWVNKQIKDTAKRINIGTYPKGDLEALYGTEGQRIEARNRLKVTKNEKALKLLSDPESPAMDEIKSKIRLQEAKKKLYTQAQNERIASGEILAPLNPVEEIRQSLLKTYHKKQLTEAVKEDMVKKGELPQEEKERGKNIKAAVKSFLAVLFGIVDVVKTIKGLVNTAIGYLQNISNVVGNLIKNSAPLGVTRKEANLLGNWGKFNKPYNGGDPNILLNAGKAFAKHTGDIIAGSKINFERLGLHGYGHLISGIIKRSNVNNPQPINTMAYVYGSLAQEYFNVKNNDPEIQKKQRAALLARHSLVLGASLPGTEDAYGALINWGEMSGKIDSKNAFNIVKVATGVVSSDPVKDPVGNAVNTIFGLPEGSNEGSEGDVDKLSDILSTLEKIKDALLKVVLANMSLIIETLLTISRGITKFAFGEDSPQYQTVKQGDIKLGAAGYQGIIRSAAKIREHATKILEKNGMQYWDATNLITKFESVEKTEQEHPGIFDKKEGRQLIIDLILYKKLKDAGKKYMDQAPDKRFFVGDGDISSWGSRSTEEINKVFFKKGFIKNGSGKLKTEEFEKLIKVEPSVNQIQNENRLSSGQTFIIGSNKQQFNKETLVSFNETLTVEKLTSKNLSVLDFMQNPETQKAFSYVSNLKTFIPSTDKSKGNNPLKEQKAEIATTVIVNLDNKKVYAQTEKKETNLELAQRNAVQANAKLG